MKNLLFLLLLCFSFNSYAANRFWDGGGDGVSWNDRLNWTGPMGGQVPTANDKAIFDGNGGGAGGANTNNDAGTALLCIDLGGADMTIGGLVVRDNANIKLDGTATLCSIGPLNANGDFTAGIIVFNEGFLDLNSGNYKSEGTPGITVGAGGIVEVGAGVNLNLISPDGVDYVASGVKVDEAEGSFTKAMLTNYGNITIGSGFYNGYNSEGCTVNALGAKIFIDYGTFPGKKGTGLIISDEFTNEGAIIVNSGFSTGTNIRPNGVFYNNPNTADGNCAVLTTTDGNGNKGFAIAGNDPSPPFNHTDYGEFYNTGIIIEDNNGPICDNNGAVPDATFLVCGPSGEVVNYEYMSGGAMSSGSVTLDSTVTRPIGTMGAPGVSSTTSFCKKIIIDSPGSTVDLQLLNSTSCGNLVCATSQIPVVTFDNPIVVTPQLEDINTTLACGEVLELSCVFIGEPHGGGYSYYETQTDADAETNPLPNSILRNISESIEIFARYEMTGGCYGTASLNVEITNPMVMVTTEDLTLANCSATVDLATGVTATEPAGGTLTYYNTQADADGMMNELVSTSVGTGTYYVRYEESACVDVQAIEVICACAASNGTLEIVRGN